MALLLCALLLLVPCAGRELEVGRHLLKSPPKPPSPPPRPPHPLRPGKSPPAVKPLCVDAIGLDVATRGGRLASTVALSDSTCSVCSKELRGCPIGRNNHSSTLKLVQNSKYLTLWRSCRSACPPGKPACNASWPALTRYDYVAETPVTYCVLELNKASLAVTVAVPCGTAVVLCIFAGLHLRRRRKGGPGLGAVGAPPEAPAGCQAPCGPPSWDVSEWSAQERAKLAGLLLDGRAQYSHPPLELHTACDASAVGFLPWLLTVAWLLVSRPVNRLACALASRPFPGWGGLDSWVRDLGFRLCQNHAVVGLFLLHPLHPVRRPLRALALLCEVLFSLAVNWLLLSGFGFHDWLRQSLLKKINDYAADYALGQDYELARVATTLVDNPRVISNMASLTNSRQTVQVALVVAAFAFVLNLPWMWLSDALLTGAGLPGSRAAMRTAGPYLLLCLGLPVCMALFLVEAF